MVNGSRVLGVLAFVVPLSCGPEEVEPLMDGVAGSPGGTGGAGNAGGKGGSGASGGKAGSAGKGAGGSAGTASGGSAGSGAAGGSVSSGGSSGKGGAGAVGGTGGGGTSGEAGDTGIGGEVADAGAGGDTIAWNEDGVISADTNDFGIQGTWFFETDCADAMPEGLPCTVRDPSLIGPDGQTGWVTSIGRVCAKGVATQVINDPGTGMPAYQIQWGVRLGFELNGTSSGTRGAYNAVTHGLRGFVFDITTNGTPPTVRVNITTTNTSASQGDAHFVEVSLPAPQQVILLSDALQGMWVTTPVPLDQNALTTVTFQIYTSVAASKPFDFCISSAKVMQ